MSVAFKELAGSPVEIYEPTGMKAQRRLLCAYEDRYAVVTALLGGSLAGDQQQAFYPNCPGIVAMRVRIEPFEKKPDNREAFADLTADLNSYSGQFVEVVVDYELPGADGSHRQLPDPGRGTSLTYRMDFGGEYIAPPSHALRWHSDASTPVTPDSVPKLRIPITEHHVTWHHVMNPPWDAIRFRVGAVNATSFLGAAAETLLFDGAKADRQFTGLNNLQQPQFGWRLTYVFREKTVKALSTSQGSVTVGWNHCYRPDSASGSHWDKLVDESNGTLYRAVDFNGLFQFAAE